MLSQGIASVHVHKHMMNLMRYYCVIGDELIYRLANAQKSMFSKFAQRHPIVLPISFLTKLYRPFMIGQ